MTTADFIKNLIQEVPELEAVYRQHIEDNDDLLPHVFMGDVTRFVIEQVGANVDTDVVPRILGGIEAGLSGTDEQVSELVSVSFAENLTTEKETVAALEPILGRELRRQLELRG